jgi:hypothetical protein
LLTIAGKLCRPISKKEVRMPKKEDLTIYLRYVPVLGSLPSDPGGTYVLTETIEVYPDPAYLVEKVNFKKIEWVALNPEDFLIWEILTKSKEEITSFSYPDNSSGPISKAPGNKLLVPTRGSRSYSIKVTGWNRWGHSVNLTKDPEIHWGRRG